MPQETKYEIHLGEGVQDSHCIEVVAILDGADFDWFSWVDQETEVADEISRRKIIPFDKNIFVGVLWKYEDTDEPVCPSACVKINSLCQHAFNKRNQTCKEKDYGGLLKH